MGIAGMVMSSGYDALWYPVCYACGYLFLLLFIAGPLRRFGAYTIPDFAEGRFDSPVFRKIAVVFVLFIGFFYTMPQMKGAGTTLAYIFPAAVLGGRGAGGRGHHAQRRARRHEGHHAGAGVSVLGQDVRDLRADLRADGGLRLLQRPHRRQSPRRDEPGRAASTSKSSASRSSKKRPTDTAWISPFGPLTTKAVNAAAAALPGATRRYLAEHQKPYSLLYTYSLIIALVCGTAGLPHILVRFYTNPDGVAAKRTTMWVMILIGVFYVFPPVFGVIGRNLLAGALHRRSAPRARTRSCSNCRRCSSERTACSARSSAASPARARSRPS